MTSRIVKSCDVLPLVRRLKELRLKTGMSQREVCEIAGLHDKAVYQWEGGLNIPTVGNFTAALNALGHDLVVRKMPKT